MRIPSVLPYRLLPAIIVSGFLLYFFFKLFNYHLTLVGYPFQAEYREGASLMTTSALVHGINPYALENQPRYTNDYGILYPLFMYPFAKIFGTTLVVHRAVNAVLIALICAFFIWILQRHKVPLLLNLSGTLILYTSLIFPYTTTACANPSPLGLLLFLLTVFGPWLNQFSAKSLALSLILGILAYYTKPYFIVGIPLIGSYTFFFVSKKKGITYTAAFIGMFGLTIPLIHHIFECYFNNCYFIHTNATPLVQKHLIRQLNWYSKLHKPLLILLGIFLIPEIIRVCRNFPTGKQNITNAASKIFSKIHLNEFNQPLFEFPFALSLYCAILNGALLVLWLGKHDGALLWYFFHLLSPFLILSVLILVTQSPIPWKIAVAAPFLIWNIGVLAHEFDADYLKNKGRDAWINVMEQISTHQNILNSPIIAGLLIEQNKPVYDNGLSEYFKLGGYRNSINKHFFQQNGKVVYQHYKYLNEIRTMVKNREFDLVLLTEGYAPFAPAELQTYYRYLGTFKLPLPHTVIHFNITVWVPK